MGRTRKRDGRAVHACRDRGLRASPLWRAHIVWLCCLCLFWAGGCRQPGERILDRGPLPWEEGELRENLRPPRVLVESFWDGTPAPEDPARMIGKVASSEVLDLETFVSEVLRVHPTLESAEAAWQAAVEVHPQVTSFADPQFRFLNGPTLFGNNAGAHLWRLQFQQELPGTANGVSAGKSPITAPSPLDWIW
jgi:hypothetical protein